MAQPFAWLPKPLYIMLIFTISALFHIILYYPRKYELIVYPYMLFYLANGIGCVAERAYRQVTGKRVGGLVGRIWTWTVLYLASQPMVASEFSTGWFGAMRAIFATQPQTSMVCWLVYALGWGPHPADILATKA